MVPGPCVVHALGHELRCHRLGASSLDPAEGVDRHQRRRSRLLQLGGSRLDGTQDAQQVAAGDLTQVLERTFFATPLATV